MLRKIIDYLAVFIYLWRKKPDFETEEEAERWRKKNRKGCA